jgi:hypothetical protein
MEAVNLKEGENILLFVDWETEQNPDEVGTLLKKLGSGAPFILEEKGDSVSQPVYSWER